MTPIPFMKKRVRRRRNYEWIVAWGNLKMLFATIVPYFKKTEKDCRFSVKKPPWTVRFFKRILFVRCRRNRFIPFFQKLFPPSFRKPFPKIRIRQQARGPSKGLRPTSRAFRPARAFLRFSRLSPQWPKMGLGPKRDCRPR